MLITTFGQVPLQMKVRSRRYRRATVGGPAYPGQPGVPGNPGFRNPARGR
jgi:hypothetical protein